MTKVTWTTKLMHLHTYHWKEDSSGVTETNGWLTKYNKYKTLSKTKIKIKASLGYLTMFKFYNLN